MKKDKLIREIYWIFRSAIHSGKHSQIKVEDGNITSFNPLKNTSCYVCDKINEIEEEIAELFGEDYYLVGKLEEKQNTKSS